MFSSRFHWDFRHNRVTEVLESKRRAGARILDLTESNPTRAELEYPADIVRAFDDPRVLSYHPAPAGMDEARAAVAAYYARRGETVAIDRILLTASTSEGYAYLFKLLTDPGDHVLVPRPSYPLFEFLATMENVDVRQYPLRYHGEWSIDFDALRELIGPRTRAIVLVNPNNPTGSCVSPAEAEQLAGLGLPLISDEVFADYGFEGRFETLLDARAPLVFSMSGLSKAAGLPQMKLGWIVVGGERRREAMERLEWIADTYLSVATPVQCAAARLLEAGESVQGQIRERTAANLACAREALRGSSADVLDVQGGWYIVLKVPQVRTEEEWVLELLEKQDVLVQPGFFYDFEQEAYLVVSLLTPPGVFREGVGRLRGLLS
jgi:aspartate/methionine/tyrosine aminotransferase